MAEKTEKTEHHKEVKHEKEGENFPFFKEFAAEIAALSSIGLIKLLAKGGFAAVTKLLGEFSKKTGEKVGENSAEWIAFKIFGPKTEDERRFNEAQTLLDPNDRVVLGKRLAALTSKQSDYYRLTVMQDTPEKIAKIIGMHARMTETEWLRQCKIMNYQMEENESTFEKFMTWMKTDAAAAGSAFDEMIDEDTEHQKQILASLEARLGQQSTRTNIGILARFGNWWHNWRERRRQLWQQRGEKFHQYLRERREYRLRRLTEKEQTKRVRAQQPKRRWFFTFFNLRSR